MQTQRRILWLRRLGVVLCVWTFALMGIGAWVKATGSGLACPDWPQCYGQWLPPFPSADTGDSYDLDGDGAVESIPYTHDQVMYEWTHRLVASLLGLPYLAFVILSLMGRDLHPWLRALPAAGGTVLLAQILLGGATVRGGNQDWLTTSHLLTATLFFAGVVLATAFAFLRPLAGQPAPAAVAAPVPPAAVPPKAARFPGEAEV